MNETKLALIFGKDGSKSKAKGPSRSEPEPASERLMAAEDVLRAVKDGDAEALDVALEDHYAACQGSTDPESDYSDDDDDGE